MNTLAQLAEDYNQVLASLPNSEHLLDSTTQLVTLSIQTESCQDEATVWKAIAEFQPKQGWLTRQSRNDWFVEPGSILAREPGNTLISAEMVNGTASLHIRLRHGHWQLSHYLENVTGAEQLIGVRRTLLSTLQSPGKLGYHVYFRQDVLHDQGAAGLREFCARFTGWEN